MGESQKSSFRRHWESYKESWSEMYQLDTYSKLLYPDKPMPHWDSSDVEDFIASDPVDGAVLKKARAASQFGAVGAAVGALKTAGAVHYWSRSPHGTVLAFAFGAVVWGTIGLEVGNHWYQLYRYDTMAAQAKFFEWLQKRA